MMQMKQGLFFSLLTYVLRKNDGRRGDGNHKQENGGEKGLELTLRAARVNAGLTQEQVHERLGIAMSTLSRIECGKSSPRYKTLCELCGISVDTQ